MKKTFLLAALLSPLLTCALPGHLFVSGNLGLLANASSKSSFDYSIRQTTTPNITVSYDNDVTYSDSYVPLGLNLGYEVDLLDWYVGISVNAELNSIKSDNRTAFDVSISGLPTQFTDNARIEADGVAYGVNTFVGFNVSKASSLFVSFGAINQPVEFKNGLALDENTPSEIDNGEQSLIGFQAGLGFNEVINNSLSLYGEYQFTKFPSKTFTSTKFINDDISIIHTNTYEISLQAFQLGLKYSF